MDIHIFHVQGTDQPWIYVVSTQEVLNIGDSFGQEMGKLLNDKNETLEKL
jgi:hypothetical protein